MPFQIGDIAPDFRARSTRGDIRFYDWLGGDWAVLLTYPEALTADGIEEVRAVEAHRADFERIGCKVIGVVAESAGDFGAWVDTLSKALGGAPFFPIVAEGAPDMPGIGGIGRSLGISVRTLVVIGPDKRVKLAIANPTIDTGRFSEILRLIESLQYVGTRQKGRPSADGLIVLPCGPSKDGSPSKGDESFSEFQPINGQKKDLCSRDHC